MRTVDLVAAARCRGDLASGRARMVRAAAGLGVGEVASALGVSHQAVSAWESGARRPSTVHALAYGRLLAAVTRAAA